MKKKKKKKKNQKTRLLVGDLYEESKQDVAPNTEVPLGGVSSLQHWERVLAGR